MNVTRDLNKELSKNEELGVELLTLVNQKNAMESEQNAISLERDQLKKEHLKLTHEMSLMQGTFSLFSWFLWFLVFFVFLPLLPIKNIL